MMDNYYEAIQKELKLCFDTGNIQLHTDHRTTSLGVFFNLQTFHANPKELRDECFKVLTDFVIKSTPHEQRYDEIYGKYEALKQENEELKKYKNFFELQKELQQGLKGE